MRAVIYARISSDREDDELGVTRQLTASRKFATDAGHTVVAELVDNDVSAYSGKPRPSYQELLQLIRGGHVDVVIALRGDRLHRSPTELEEYITACDPRSVPTYTVRAGKIDLSTPSGRAVARTIGAWARYESEVMAERIRDKKQELAERGLPSGSWRPFGYEDDQITVRPGEAQLIADATRRIIAGESIHGVCTEWRAHGVLTAQGKLFTPQGLRRTLLRPRNAGRRVHTSNGVRTEYEAVWKPVVTSVEFRALEKILNDPTRLTSPGYQPKYLGSMLYRCGATFDDGTVCDHPLISSKVGKNPRRLVYICGRKDKRGVNHVVVTREAVDDHVTEQLLGKLEESGFTVNSQVSDEMPDATAALDELVREQEFQKSLYDDRLITPEQYRTELTRIALRRKEIEDAQLQDFSRSTVTLLDRLSENPREQWERMSVDERRFVIAEIVSVVVRPAGRTLSIDERVDLELDLAPWFTDIDSNSAIDTAWTELNPQLPGESLSSYMKRSPE